MRPLITLLALAGLLSAAGRAAACGLSPPIGPNGLPVVCHGDTAEVRVRVGLSVGGTQTEIEFEDGSADLRQGAAAATLDLYPTERLGLNLSLGAALTGELEFQGETYDLLPGPLVGAGVSYRFWGGAAPFVHTSFTLSVARSLTRSEAGGEEHFLSRDMRLGVAVGKAFGKVAAPFVVGRLFGAGTDWPVADGHGADAHLYHVGVGSAFGLPGAFDALVELAFLGERRASVGVGYLF